MDWKNKMGRLKILSIGAGAIGTYIGGSLALSGNSVVFLERPETARAIQHLRLTLLGQEHLVENPVFATSIEEALALGPYDLALSALKSFDTSTALLSFKPFADQLPPFLCLQNGVENESLIAEILGEEKVIHGTVTSAVGKPGLGEIILEKFRGIGISNRHPLSKQLHHVFNQANLNAELFDDPDAMKWSKMLTNLVSNATSAILALPPNEIFSHPDLFRVEMEQLKETLAVMKSYGIPVVDLPGTPVRLLAFAVKAIPPVIARPLLKKAVVGGRGDKMPSFFIDMQSGRANSEVDFLNGAVVRWGRKKFVATPANSFLTETLLGMVHGPIPKEKYRHNPDLFVQNYSKSKD